MNNALKELQDLPLLQRLSTADLAGLVQSYRYVLTLAKIAAPVAVFLILFLLSYHFFIAGKYYDYGAAEVIKTATVGILFSTIAIFAIVIPGAFIRLRRLNQRIKALAEGDALDSGLLKCEFKTYLHRIIAFHYGINF